MASRRTQHIHSNVNIRLYTSPINIHIISNSITPTTTTPDPMSIPTTTPKRITPGRQARPLLSRRPETLILSLDRSNIAFHRPAEVEAGAQSAAAAAAAAVVACDCQKTIGSAQSGRD
jgi:hypothetical protein